MISNDKVINKDEIAVNLKLDIVAKTGLNSNDKNKERLHNLIQSKIFVNELEWIKVQAERHATELFKKYLRKIS